MPQPVISETDPANGAEGLANAQAVTVVYGRGQGQKSAYITFRTDGPVLVAPGSAAFVAKRVGSPFSRVAVAASALVTFPAIYKPYREDTGPTPGPVTYPPMRVYPPIIPN